MVVLVVCVSEFHHPFSPLPNTPPSPRTVQSITIQQNRMTPTGSLCLGIEGLLNSKVAGEEAVLGSNFRTRKSEVASDLRTWLSSLAGYYERTLMP